MAGVRVLSATVLGKRGLGREGSVAVVALNQLVLLLDALVDLSKN